MGRPEASVENYLRAQVKAHGGQTRKVAWIGRKGAPDRIVWWKFPFIALVECKAPGEEVDWRSLQGREIKRLRDDRWPVCVVASRQEVDALIVMLKAGGQ